MNKTKQYALLFLALLTLSAYSSKDNLNTDPTDIENGWRTKTIVVQNGGKTPTVMQLLRAFNAVWHTDAADIISSTAGDKEDFIEEWYEGQSPVFVDNIDYCTAWYNPDGTDGQRLACRTYQRKNGHMLFAVRIGQAKPGQKAFCCFYDYNPKKQTLTPEDEPYKDLKRKSQHSVLNYYLGEKYDQTVIVEEILEDGNSWYHHYAWNGKKHVFHHVGEDSYGPDDEGYDE